MKQRISKEAMKSLEDEFDRIQEAGVSNEQSLTSHVAADATIRNCHANLIFHLLF